MLISMTGFGQGEARDETHTVSVEIRTVNHRFLDYSLKLPRVLNHRERDIKELVRQRIARGRVYLTVSVDSEAADRNIKINLPLMERYLTLLREFAATHDVAGEVDINTLAQLSDAMVNDQEEEDIQTLWPLTEEALGRAADECRKMRVAEGKALEKDLKSRMRQVEKTVVQIEKSAPAATKRHAEAFRKRIEQLAGDATVDEDRLVTEIALMADRLDVTEEITRLRSHVDQFNQAVAAGGEVSKKLTYILQEIHREVSTIGAKASDSDIAQLVVALKEETEKLREQVQNLE